MSRRIPFTKLPILLSVIAEARMYTHEQRDELIQEEAAPGIFDAESLTCLWELYSMQRIELTAVSAHFQRWRLRHRDDSLTPHFRDAAHELTEVVAMTDEVLALIARCRRDGSSCGHEGLLSWKSLKAYRLDRSAIQALRW